MDLAVVRDVHTAINLVHRLAYFVPEAAEETAALGVTGRGGYFGPRAAPLGAVGPEIVIATFYNFSPAAVRTWVPKVWTEASPEALQQARFRAAARAMERVGARLTPEQLAEARSIIDPVVARLDLAGKTLAAANAAVPLPDDPMLALWQQVAVLREYRGDVHVAALVFHELGPCDCMVVQVGTGRFPMGVTRATRQWTDDEWVAAVGRLAARGWTDASGAMTPAGIEARERIEHDTDRLCASAWAPVGEAGAARLRDLIWPIHQAIDAAGTYALLA